MISIYTGRIFIYYIIENNTLELVLILKILYRVYILSIYKKAVNNVLLFVHTQYIIQGAAA